MSNTSELEKKFFRFYNEDDQQQQQISFEKRHENLTIRFMN